MKRLSKVALTLTSVVLAGLACFEGFLIYFWMQNRNSEESKLLALLGIGVFLSTMLLLALMPLHYLLIRWIDIPCWRWMIGGCKGEPKLPFPRFSWATKSAKAEAKSKMNNKQRACIWFGNTCATVGVISMLISSVWFVVLDITGEHHIGSIPFKLFWIGAFIFFTGTCISGLVYQRILRTGDRRSKA